MAIPGIRIRNPNSVIQIDSNYKNLGLRYSTTLTAPTSGGTANGFYYVTYTVPYSASQIVAFRGSANTMLVENLISGSAISYKFAIAQAGGTINVRIFDDPNLISAAAGTTGIVMKNNGVKFFDSRLKYMKVVDFRTATANPSSAVSVAPAGVTNLYVCQLQPVWERVVIPQGPSTRVCVWSGCAVSFSGQTASISTQSFDTLTSNNMADVLSAFIREGYAYLFIDCLGF